MGNDWRQWAAAVFVMALVATVVYSGVGFLAEWLNPVLEAPEKQEKKIHPDFYVYHPKSHVNSFESAQKLIGKPLWVKEGYRWTYEPGGKTLKPLERIVPTGVRKRGSEVLLDFQKNGRHSIVIGSDGNFFVDEIFLLKNPRELYDHWSEEVWENVEAHEVEPGMTEFQVTFALGAGSLSRYSPGGSLRVINYTLREKSGLPPLRVTFEDGIAQKIERIPASE